PRLRAAGRDPRTPGRGACARPPPELRARPDRVASARRARRVAALRSGGAVSRARALLFCLLAACGRDAFRLPAEIRLEQVVADLSATFDRAAIVEEAAGAPVHLGGIQPTPHFGDP